MKNVLLNTACASAMATLLLAGAPAFAQTPDTTADTPVTSTAAAAHDKDVDARIKSLHDKLQITKDQEAMWSKVAGAMYDNAMAARAEYQERQDKQDSMTAIEDIRSSQTHMQDRADGLKKLADAFEPLYQAMTPAQQQNADKVFGHEHKKHMDAGMKKGPDKE
jgi:hypothetical protein